MAAHPNGKQLPHVTAALVRPTDTLRIEPAPPDVTPDAAWRLLYQELFDFAPDAHVLTDTAGVIRAVNHAAAEVLRARKDFIIGKPLVCFIAQCDWGSFYNWLLRIRAGEADALTDRPLHAQPAHGPMRPMMVHVAACAEGHGGRMLRWRLLPLTNYQELERTLRHERYFIDSVLDTAQALVLVLDARGTIQRASAAVCALLGRTNEELRGRHWRCLF